MTTWRRKERECSSSVSTNWKSQVLQRYMYTHVHCLNYCQVSLSLSLSLPLQSVRTDCNHIFLNFVPPVILDPHQLQEKMLTIISQYGIRLYKLRVTEAEIKILIRSVQWTNGPHHVLNLHLNSSTGAHK